MTMAAAALAAPRRAQGPALPRPARTRLHLRQAGPQSRDRQRTGAGLCGRRLGHAAGHGADQPGEAAVDRRELRRRRSHGAGAHTIRAVGKVAFDETRIARVHSQHRGLDRAGLRRFHRQAGGRRASRCSPSTVRNCWRRSRSTCWPLKSEGHAAEQPVCRRRPTRATRCSTPRAAAAGTLGLERGADRADRPRRASRSRNITLYSPDQRLRDRSATPFRNSKVTPETELYTHRGSQPGLDHGRCVRVRGAR